MALVKKANQLINYQYQLSIAEQRLVLYLIGKIQMPDEDFREYQFTFTELVKILEVDKNYVYRDLERIRQALLSKPIIFNIGQGDSDGFNWCSRFTIRRSEKTVSMRFDPALKPYLLQLKKCFTRYQIKYVTGFTSKHSFRVYELCKQFEKLKKRKMELIEFKRILDIENSYSKIYDLKKYVLNPALEDINEHSDILISAKYFKTRRSITDIEFTISNKLENCKNEKQEEMIIEETKEQSRIQEEKIENQEKSAARTKIWNEMSDADKQKNYPGNSGYIKFMASFTSGHC